jgi:hypothetical protein
VLVNVTRFPVDGEEAKAGRLHGLLEKNRIGGIAETSMLSEPVVDDVILLTAQKAAPIGAIQCLKLVLTEKWSLSIIIGLAAGTTTASYIVSAMGPATFISAIFGGVFCDTVPTTTDMEAADSKGRQRF